MNIKIQLTSLETIQWDRDSKQAKTIRSKAYKAAMSALNKADTVHIVGASLNGSEILLDVLEKQQEQIEQFPELQLAVG